MTVVLVSKRAGPFKIFIVKMAPNLVMCTPIFCCADDSNLSPENEKKQVSIIHMCFTVANNWNSFFGSPAGRCARVISTNCFII